MNVTDAKDAKNPFSATLNLPQTPFSMRANLPKREPDWVQRWLDMDVYGQLRQKRAGTDKFILHLGPPYANGHMHMGHALTYVLKDFIVRAKFMSGLDAPYVPGWDCHGLPIEWKIEQGLREQKQSKYDFTTAELRAKCRDYASHWIDIQKSEWQRFGALADWDEPYLTMSKASEAGIVAELGTMVRRGVVYQGLRSTMWSTVEETALAEAEVEYADKESTAVYVKFPIVGRDNEHVVIWTTTPWTLPANRAVAYNPEEEYIPLHVNTDTLWIAAKLLEDFTSTTEATVISVGAPQKGTAFATMHCQHPFYPERTVPLLPGDHVTTDAGTGFVHTAPAHGQEDFELGKQCGLNLHCPVLGNGLYDETVDPLPNGTPLAGEHIWKAQPKIVEAMQENGSLVKAYSFTHSYPVSWRSKAPLIFRATQQWFVGLDIPVDELGGKSIRQASLEAIHGSADMRKVDWQPPGGEQRIGNMIAHRGDWCISRQRAWGVPITIIQHKQTGEIVTDKAVWDHIVSLIAAEGIDAWDNRIEEGRQTELFPTGWLENHGYTTADFHFEQNILDVWFDSGTTHAHVVRADSAPGGRFHRTDGKRPVDLYQEGSDQHRGWFHSSMLTSISNYGEAPYEQVLTSGFVVDGHGRKFSKSLGNGVEPRELLDNFGMDIIRLWVARSDYTEDVRYSPDIMQATADDYRRFRNSFRFLLGNLHDFTPDAAVDPTHMPALDQFILHRLQAVSASVRDHYDAYRFHHAIRELYDFCNITLSNFYFDARKDSLYCDAKNNPRRRSCQTVLHHILQVLCTHLAPVMPFTTDEAWRAYHGDDTCVHLQTFHTGFTAPVPNQDWTAIQEQRDVVNQHIEDIRTKGDVGANVDVAVTLPDMLGLTATDWQDILVVSQVSTGAKLHVAKATGHKCPRCWMYHETLAESGVCTRCDDALKTDGHNVKAA